MNIKAKDLKRIARVIGCVVSEKSPDDVLSSVIFGDGQAVAKSETVQVQAKVESLEGDKVCLPFSRIQKVAAACDNDAEITIKSDGEASTGKNKWRLNTLDPEAFAVKSQRLLKPCFRVPADHFCRAVKVVASAADRLTHNAMSGVLFEIRDGVVNLVGSDGKRLYVHSFDVDQAVDDSRVTVPLKALQAVLATGGNEEEAIQVEANSKCVVFETEKYVITASQLATEYPNWQTVVPSSVENQLEFVCVDLKESIKAASVVTSDVSSAVSFEAKGQRLLIRSNSSEYGKSLAECKVIESDGDFKFSANPKFFTDWLSNIDGSEVVKLEVIDDKSAVVMSCEDSKCVVMPVCKD